MNPHNLKGKGIWLWKIHQCEGGDGDAIVARAQSAGFTHLILKVCDGDDPYNIWNGRDGAVELIPKLRQAGIGVWGWNYIYGDPPARDQGKPRYWELEAQANVRRLKQLAPLGLQGFVIDAEREYETIPDRQTKAAQYLAILREGLPDLPLALASWKYPFNHGVFPWASFRSKLDLDMPQVYWIQSHDPAAQLQKSFQQFKVMQPRLPLVAVGPAFFESNWRPAPQEITDFLAQSAALGLPAASLWAWDYLGLRGGESYNPRNLNFTVEWDAVANFDWSQPPQPAPAPQPPPAQPGGDILDQYFAALNTHNPDVVTVLYNRNAGHVTAQSALVGATAIRAFYAGLFAMLPDAMFMLTNASGLGPARTFTWTAVGSTGTIFDGNDTLGVLNGRIQYHYTSFTFKATG